MTTQMQDVQTQTATGATGATVPQTLEQIRTTVQARYGAAAQRVLEGATTPASCCGPTEESSGCCGATSETWDPITADLYEAAQTAGLPAEALLASLGCGNPTALAGLREGEVVLDLGSGGGIDVLLSAKRVGPTGKAYGLDMTDEMLALARENQRKAGATNVRVLKPGGRFAVSDVVVRGEVPADIRRSMELWVGCVAGALEEREYAAKLQAAGFADVEVEPWRIYNIN